MVSLFGLLFGCGPKRTLLYEENCNDQSLEFSVKEKSHYATLQFWMEIKIGKLKVIKITPEEVYRQTPYSFNLINNYPHYLYDTSQKQTKFGETEVNRRKMLVFIDPEKYSKQDFEIINKCLSQHYSNIETALYDQFINASTRAHFNHPQFAGILYANINDFNLVYSNEDNSKTITILFDGNIILEEKGGKIDGKSILGIMAEKQEGFIPEYKLKADVLDFRNKKTGNNLAEDFSFYTNKDNIVFWVKN